MVFGKPIPVCGRGPGHRSSLSGSGPSGSCSWSLSADVKRNGGAGWQRHLSSGVPRWALIPRRLLTPRKTFNMQTCLSSLWRSAHLRVPGRVFFPLIVLNWIINKLEFSTDPVTGMRLSINQLTQPVALLHFNSSFVPLSYLQLYICLCYWTTLLALPVLTNTCCWHFVDSLSHCFFSRWVTGGFMDMNVDLLCVTLGDKN